LRRRELLTAAATTPFLIALACRQEVELAADEVPARGGAPRPRDLLVIVSDDQSRFDLGTYGNPSCTTPNVDALAAEGARFTAAYTPVSLCMPARSCLYTGLYPHRNGATGFEPIRPGVRTWPSWLAGTAATGMVGKFNVKPAEQFPFDVLKRGGTIDKDGRSPEKYERLFAEFLGEVGERPFAALVNLKDPHRPFDEDRFVDQVDGPPPSAHDPEEVWVPGCLWDTPETRRELADYHGALQRLDETVGRVLRLLDESGRAPDTLVVFTSDNGMPFPYAKATLYEAGINLPFVVRWPGVVAAGGRSQALVSLLDVLPTALELFGLPPGELNGHSLLPLLRGEVESVREEWFAMHTSQKIGEDYPSRSLRAGDVKYIRNLAPEATFKITGFKSSRTWQSWLELVDSDDPPPGLAAHMDRLLHRPAEELYDLASDPFERTNLLGTPAREERHADDLARMRATLAEQMQAFGDEAGLAAVAASTDEPEGSDGR
jgi:N-sulfoglucosamine sulfohydrolase